LVTPQAFPCESRPDWTRRWRSRRLSSAAIR
jgi:hypothetical protein